MKRSQMQTLNWSPDRRPYLSYRILLCRDGQPDALSGRACEPGAAGLAVSEQLRIGVLDRLESGHDR
jgi:hypothetical protein